MNVMVVADFRFWFLFGVGTGFQTANRCGEVSDLMTHILDVYKPGWGAVGADGCEMKMKVQNK